MTALLIMTDVWLEVWLQIYIESLWQHCDTPKLNIRTVLQSTLLFLLNTNGHFIGRPLLNTLFRRYDESHHSKRARDVQPLLVQCWAIVYDAGPTLHQHWLNVRCLWNGLKHCRFAPSLPKYCMCPSRWLDTVHAMTLSICDPLAWIRNGVALNITDSGQ